MDLELPACSKAAGFAAPPPLKATLLDVTMPLSLAAVWLALFRGSSSLLADFHQQLGDLAVTISAWRRQQGEPPGSGMSGLVRHYSAVYRDANPRL